MASPTAIAFLAIFLLLHPPNANAINDFLAPLLAPIFDKVCDEIECGKGNCKASRNSTFFFQCECDSGWKQALDDDNLRFLPCIIPNCTLNHSCNDSPAFVPEKSHANETLFDPCHWATCGAGSCNKTSDFTYSCDCAEGYYNLLNASFLPCFKECAIGVDCSRLGISLSNSSATPPPALSGNNENQARLILEGNVLWLMILMMSLAMFPWI